MRKRHPARDCSPASGRRPHPTPRLKVGRSEIRPDVTRVGASAGVDARMATASVDLRVRRYGPVMMIVTRSITLTASLGVP